MLTIRGRYQNGSITLLESFPKDMRSAELKIDVFPLEWSEQTLISNHRFDPSGITGEKAIEFPGLNSFFDGDDDASVDWEDCFGLK